MPKRRRLYTPLKNKAKLSREIIEAKEKEVTTARGRLKGALMDVLEPSQEDSDESVDASPSKRERLTSVDKSFLSDDEDRLRRRRSPQRQSYVLKLFDRSVDLSQFQEDSPLYPICRAWIANQPKANYSQFRVNEEPDLGEDSVELPGPEGPVVSRIPDLLPEQLAANKDNINLNNVSVPPSREQLLGGHARRWAAVRRAWLRRALLVEARYETTQQLLNNINVNA